MSLKKLSNRMLFLVTRLLFSLFVVVLIIALGEFAIRSDMDHEKAILQDALYSTGTVLAQQIQQNVSTGIFATETLHSLLELSNYDVSQFERWCQSILSTNSHVSALQLAPAGVVKFVCPLDDHRGALGHDLLSDQRRDDGALKAIRSRALTFVGPLKLIQNGKSAVIARRPVFSKTDNGDQFWGFAIALIYMDVIVPPELLHLEDTGVQFSLSGYDPDALESPIFATSAHYHGHEDICIPIDVPNGKWRLKLALASIDNRVYLPVRIFYFGFALLAGSLIYLQQIRSRRKTEMILALNSQLKELSFKDELTGLDNRRSANHTLNNLIHQARRFKEPLCVGMIDLDFFKQVNDRYGHPVGDALLRHCAVTLKAVIRESDTLARIGGDEFICLFPRTQLKAAITTAEKMSNILKQNPFIWQGQVISISLSFGVEMWDRECSQQELLKRVDDQLYLAKEAGRDRVSYDETVSQS